MKETSAKTVEVCSADWTVSYPMIEITGGSARKTAVDVETGASFIQFEVDYLAQQEDGHCSICGAIIQSGWLCLDGGEEYCDEHVVILNELTEEERRVLRGECEVQPAEDRHMARGSGQKAGSNDDRALP